jgi:hypothetical protein
MIARWEAELHLNPGELDHRLRELDARLKNAGKDGALGTCSEAEWLAEPQLVAGLDQVQVDAFVPAF